MTAGSRRIWRDPDVKTLRANIDHLVIGPTGVFTVETKHYSSDVVIGRGQARHAGHSMDPVVQQANRQAEAVRAVLESPVRAIVCVQGAAVTVDGWFVKPLVDGVRFCSGRRLVDVIARLPRELDGDEAARLVDRAEQVLGRPSPVPAGSAAEAPSCECGGTLVLRHRRADGAGFLGCSRYPACHRTQPLRAAR